jgi:thioredoxin-related protein
MKSAASDSVMFAYFGRIAERYLYAPNSPYRNDEYFILFLKQIVNTSILDDTHNIRARYLLNLAYKNNPGNNAEDLQSTLANGKRGNIYGIKADYLLLMFFNPGCKECQNTTETLQKTAEISSSLKNNTLKILAIYPDENLDKWKEHMAEIPSNWINGYDETLSIREKEIYDLKAIPTLYLLDKEKKVILKDCSVEDINNFFKAHPPH